MKKQNVVMLVSRVIFESKSIISVLGIKKCTVTKKNSSVIKFSLFALYRYVFCAGVYCIIYRYTCLTCTH